MPGSMRGGLHFIAYSHGKSSCGEHRIDDLLNLAHAPHGLEASQKLVGLHRVHGSLDDARRHRVHHRPAR